MFEYFISTTLVGGKYSVTQSQAVIFLFNQFYVLLRTLRVLLYAACAFLVCSFET